MKIVNCKLKIKSGFTLIETIVVVAIIGLILPVLISTVFILVREQTKVIRLSQVKQEGDYLINIMENTIRDRAVTIYKSAVLDDSNIVCKDALSSYSSPTSDLYFLDKDGQFFGYKLNGITVASDSAHPAVLTSDKTKVSIFSISCSRNAIYSPPSVSINFTIQYNTTSTLPEETASLHYQTMIKLRNY